MPRLLGQGFPVSSPVASRRACCSVTRRCSASCLALGLSLWGLRNAPPPHAHCRQLCWHCTGLRRLRKQRSPYQAAPVPCKGGQMNGPRGHGHYLQGVQDPAVVVDHHCVPLLPLEAWGTLRRESKLRGALSRRVAWRPSLSRPARAGHTGRALKSHVSLVAPALAVLHTSPAGSMAILRNLVWGSDSQAQPPSPAQMQTLRSELV